MNQSENQAKSCACEGDSPECFDASCRVPLLALFGGAALWLLLGVVLGLAAAMSFHNPDTFAKVPALTFGRAQAAANSLILYGFIVPSALGVILWIATRLGQAKLALPIVPVIGANLIHVGVALGTVLVLAGFSTGHPWLEYPRAAAVIFFGGFMLCAISAVATMGFRKDKEMYPAHWFLFASLLWFAWTYSTGNLFLDSVIQPRGVVQAIIDWWYSNNVLFVWLGLTGLGIAFYFLPKFSGYPLATTGYALFALVTLMLFGTWCGIPQGAPVPAWLPSVSAFGAMLSLLTLLAVLIIFVRTVREHLFKIVFGPFCTMKMGTMGFLLSGLFYVCQFCPRYSHVLDLTWFGVGVSQWQLFGFAGLIVYGGINEILPRVMGRSLPLGGLTRVGNFCFGAGALVYVIPLLIAGVAQGKKLADPSVPFADVTAAVLMPFRISSVGQALLLLAALCLLLNTFIMTIQWKLGLLKAGWTAVTAPLPPGTGNVPLRTEGEVKS